MYIKAMHIKQKAFAAGIAGLLLLLPLTSAHAKTVAFTGTMKTQVDFGRTYTVALTDPVQTLTLSIPMPQEGSLFSYAEKIGQSAIDSNVTPTREMDTADGFGNRIHVMEYENLPLGTLIVHVNVTGVVLTTDLSTALSAAPFPVTGVSDDAAACLQPTEHVQSDADGIRTLAQTITAGSTDEVSAARAISRWMLANITYDTAGPTARTPALTTLTDHKAKCDGWANLYLALARASGIPARYVGGYWISPKIAYTGYPSTSPQIAGDHTHTWVELWFPGAGWVPCEPQQTAGFVDTHHLRVWQVPDSGMTARTLGYTSGTTTKPQVALSLISTFTNITDTLALTPAGTTDEDAPKSLFTRK